MGSENLKISIITVCYNAEKTIGNAIRSVISQTYKYIEYIIIDGDSTDSTLNIIKRYKDNIDVLISEKDNGIYDAMNKGIKASSGDILYFLNADDVFYNASIVEKIVEVFLENPANKIVYGKIIVGNNTLRNTNLSQQHNPYLKNKIDLFVKGMCHQSFFSKKDVFNITGLFNLKYKISADFDWAVKLFQNEIPMVYIDNPIAFYNPEGISHKNIKLRRNEKQKIIFQNSTLFDLIRFSFRRIKYI
jgi:glycosyltransferase involved in cell wall biosynthesis